MKRRKTRQAARTAARTRCGVRTTLSPTSREREELSPARSSTCNTVQCGPASCTQYQRELEVGYDEGWAARVDSQRGAAAALLHQGEEGVRHAVHTAVQCNERLY